MEVNVGLGWLNGSNYNLPFLLVGASARDLERMLKFELIFTEFLASNMYKQGLVMFACMCIYWFRLHFQLFFHLWSICWVSTYQLLILFLSLIFEVNCKSFIAVELLLYAPDRPVVDYAVIFLWLMAVGTLFCASLWSDFTASEKTDERYNELSPKVFCSTIYSLSYTSFLISIVLHLICVYLSLIPFS